MMNIKLLIKELVHTFHFYKDKIQVKIKLTWIFFAYATFIF